MENSFIKWMKWFGKTYSNYLLEKGDFLCEEVKEKINNAT